MDNILKVDLKENSYNIVFEKSFDLLAKSLKEIGAPKKLLVVTDTNVEKLYGGDVMDILAAAGYDAALHGFEAGEQNKSMDTILGICGACLEHKMDRKSMIVALGGGVVGDMAGFAAAIFMRGIRFVQVPTTLLSQSDSSVGGKTGIDFGGSKNILGAFHQPKLVYINVATLSTLSEREFISGMGEVIKHGIIRDRSFFDYLENNADKIKSLDNDTLMYMARVNCAIKAAVVSEDERETGLRAVLNFGHTVGHAVESAADFALTHGACVGIGMCAVARIAQKRGMISAEEAEKIKRVLELYGFDTSVRGITAEKIYEHMGRDKKSSDGQLKFVLPTGIGEVGIFDDVTLGEIDDAVRSVICGGQDK